MTKSRHATRSMPTACGITLIELSLSMLITSILVSLSFPSMLDLRSSTETTITLQRLNNALESAKVAAIGRRVLEKSNHVVRISRQHPFNCQGGWSDVTCTDLATSTAKRIINRTARSRLLSFSKRDRNDNRYSRT